MARQNKFYGTGKNTENNVIDAGNLLTVGDTFHKISKRAKADANTFDINCFLDP